MNNLSATAFIVPAIALFLVIAGYISLSKRTTNKVEFRNFSLTVITFSMLFHFAWEMLQMPLFENMSLDWQTILFCAAATIADTIMMLLLYYAFAIIYKEPFWINRLSFLRVLLLVVAGAAGAIAAELRHTSAGSWSYSRSMPLIPAINVGISPVLQFMVLPLLVYYLAYQLVNKRVNKDGHDRE